MITRIEDVIGPDPTDKPKMVSEPHLLLSWGELIVMDKLLTPSDGFIVGLQIKEAVEGWHEFRFRTWRCLAKYAIPPNWIPRNLKDKAKARLEKRIERWETAKHHRRMFFLDEDEARILFAVLPNSVRLGDGVDYGYSLKMKLYKFLKGVQDAANKNDTPYPA